MYVTRQWRWIIEFVIALGFASAPTAPNGHHAGEEARSYGGKGRRSESFRCNTGKPYLISRARAPSSGLHLWSSEVPSWREPKHGYPNVQSARLDDVMYITASSTTVQVRASSAPCESGTLQGKPVEKKTPFGCDSTSFYALGTKCQHQGRFRTLPIRKNQCTRPGRFITPCKFHRWRTRRAGSELVGDSSMFRTLISRIATGPILRTSPAASGIEPINFRNKAEVE